MSQRPQRLRGQVEQSRNVGHAHGFGNYAQFIQPAAMFHQVGKGLGVAGSVGVVKPGGDRLVAQRHDPVHGRHALGADLNALETTGAVPDARGLVEHPETLL